MPAMMHSTVESMVLLGCILRVSSSVSSLWRANPLLANHEGSGSMAHVDIKMGCVLRTLCLCIKNWKLEIGGWRLEVGR